MDASSLVYKLSDPGLDGGCDRLQVGAKAVIARHLGNRPIRGWRRHTERITLALNDERRDRDRVELGQPARGWIAGAAARLQGKGQAEDGDAARRLEAAAGHARAERPPTDDQGRPVELVRSRPGITIPELADAMGIKQNYLYRVLPGLQKDGLVRKEGSGWHPREGAEAA